MGMCCVSCGGLFNGRITIGSAVFESPSHEMLGNEPRLLRRKSTKVFSYLLTLA